MNYWILQVNPNHFKLTKEYPYNVGQDDWWCLSRARKIYEEDTVFVWKSTDYRNQSTGPKPRGIYAQARVLSVPPHHPTIRSRIQQAQRHDQERWVESTERSKQESKPIDILISYQYIWETEPLTVNEIRNAGLGDLHIIKFPHIEICSVSHPNAMRLLELLENKRRD